MMEAASLWQRAATQATQTRDWPALQHIARQWTVAQPDSVQAWQTLSRSHFEQLQFNDAVLAFNKVLQLEPDSVLHQVSAARLATAAQQYQQARVQLLAALTHPSLNTSEVLTAGDARAAVVADIQYALARVYHLTGELAEAEVCCRRSISLRPGFPPAYALLAALREGELTDTDITQIQSLLQHPQLHAEYRAMLGFALGDALDRRADYDAAFSAWTAANRVNQHIYQQEGIVYQREQQEAEYQLLDKLFAEPPHFNYQAGVVTPIFVVGMPRSGTTLAESILASHSQVSGAGELPGLCEIYDELMTAARHQGIYAASDLLQQNAVVWRKQYLAALPSSGRAYVVDKQPLNFRAVGLIRVLFPESPIVYTQRTALDIGFSIYRHNFTKNWPCAHRLEDIAHYLHEHARIMALWLQRYSSQIHVLDHAALVQNPQQEIQRLLNYTGLAPEEACLRPHQTQRSIATFSAVQVRKPVSAAYSGRAAHYLRWLRPLLALEVPEQA